jgi:WD40 repeat protein
VADSDRISELLLEVARAPDRDPSALAPDLRPGMVVGRFELVREIGRGGFGVVFEARDRDLGRLVAFKAMRRMRPERAGELEQPLREEAEAAARLNHPNVVTLHDYGMHDGTPYLILELLRGETLQARLRRGEVPPGEAVRIALDIARGLVHAHAAGVLHRDLKPGNVYLCDGGGVKLLDFGLARLFDRGTGSGGGTPAYMAPEQFRGEPGDARADVFSAAVVLFHMLAGELPFPVSRGRSAALDAGPPPRLPLPDAPPELAALLASALSRDPAGRPQSAQAFLDALQGVERAYARLAALAARAERRRRIRRALYAAAAVLVVAAGGVTALAVRAREEAERALRASRIASAAESATDPLVAALLMAELGDDPPPRALDVAQRILAQPIPTTVIDAGRGNPIAVSPDGTRVAAGMRDGSVSIHALDGAGAPIVLRGGGRRVNAVAFTPDGTRVVAAGHDGDLRVFRADGAGTAVVHHLGDSPLVRVRVSTDGRVAATGAVDGRVWLVPLDAPRPPPPAVLGGAVFDLAFAPDGTRIAVATADGMIHLLGRDGAAVAEIPVPGGAVYMISFSPDGRTVLAASEDGAARLFGADGRGPLAVLGEPPPRGKEGGAPSPRPPVVAARFSPDGRRVATASLDHAARVWTVDGSAPAVRLRHPDKVYDVAFSPDGRRVLTRSGDGLVRLWPADGEGNAVVLGGPRALAAAFTADGERVVTRTAGALRVWSARDPHEDGVLRGHEGLVDTVAWSRDGSRLLTAGHDGTARLWPLRGGAPVVVRDPSGCLHAADLDPAERRIVVASQDGTVRIWTADGARLVRELHGHEGAVLGAAWSPDGARVASVGLDRTVRIWSVDGGAEPIVLRGHDGALTGVAWTPDGRTVISSSEYDATVRLWPSDGGAPRVIRAENPVFRARPSADGALLAVPEEDGPLRLFRIADLVELPPFPARPDALMGAAFSPDGSRVALVSKDGTVRVLPREGGGEQLLLRGHEASVVHAAFSPDGAELATSSWDGTVHVWIADWSRLVARLRASTTACLPVPHRVQLLGERQAEAQARNDACQRAHGRVPGRPAAVDPEDRAAQAEAPSGARKG